MKNEEKPSSQTDNEFKNRFEVKTLIGIMLLVLLAVAIILWNPKFDNENHLERRITLTAQVLTQERPGSLSTPIPPEYVDYPSQTNGIILGSVVIVLIIIGGTFSVIQHQP